jgi:hypothetical protein
VTPLDAETVPVGSSSLADRATQPAEFRLTIRSTQPTDQYAGTGLSLKEQQQRKTSFTGGAAENGNKQADQRSWRYSERPVAVQMQYTLLAFASSTFPARQQRRGR